MDKEVNNKGSYWRVSKMLQERYCVAIQMQFCFYTKMQSIKFLYTRRHLVRVPGL